MKTQEKEHGLTRQRLLEAAGEVFAERGFRDAVVREICQKAGANVAAINYHFGNKERLYVAVLKHSYQTAMQKYPPTLGLTEQSSPEEHLFAFVHALLLRLLDAGRPTWHGKLMAREMAAPTAAFEEMIQEMVEPLFQRLRKILSALSPSLDEACLNRCCASVFGQCVFYYHARAVVRRVYPAQSYSPAAIETLAQHVTRFSLAGVAASAADSKSSEEAR
jgi:AcrR family transcriptional regulator